MKKTIIAALSLLGIVSCKTPNLEAFRAEALSAKFLTPSTETITFEKVLDKHKGKVIVLDVWASWCSDCIKAMPKLKQLQAEYPQIIGDVRNAGAMIAVEFVHDGDVSKPYPELAKNLSAKAAENGLVLLSCGIRGNVIRFLPALTIEMEIIDEGMEIFKRIFKELV